jgi:hypothetical protein
VKAVAEPQVKDLQARWISSRRRQEEEEEDKKGEEEEKKPA